MQATLACKWTHTSYSLPVTEKTRKKRKTIENAG